MAWGSSTYLLGFFFQQIHLIRHIMNKKNTVKVLFFVGINFRGLVKNYKFKDS
jgi:hypothetical protein